MKKASWSIVTFIERLKKGETMTGLKAIKMAEARLECLKNDTSGIAEKCNRGCENCDLHYAQGNLGEQKEWLAMLIENFKQYIENINAGGI